ncbi:MAG: DUF4209 domain-containing protein [Terriglobia bacterium]|jgi:hypothetical protein
MALEVPGFAKAVIEDFDRTLAPLEEVELMGALGRATKPLDYAPTPERDKGYTAEFCAFQFQPRPDGEDSVWGTYFGPMFSLSSPQQGRTVYKPDVADLDHETVEHWQRRSAEAQHPVLRARYADLAWDLARAITNDAPDVAFAATAIDAYVAAIDGVLYKIPIRGIWWATRALNLAVGIAHKDRIEGARDAMFRLYDRVAVPHLAGTWPFLFDTLYGNKKVPLQEDQKQKIIGSLEGILRHCTAEGSGPNLFAAKAAALRLGQHYQRIGQTEDAKRVHRVCGQAVELYAAKASPSIAMSWLQQVYEDYRRQGMTEDAKRAHLALEAKARNIGADMKKVAAEIRIPEGQLESYLVEMTSGGLEAALDRIAAHFIPSADQARERLRITSEIAPLSSMIPVAQVTTTRFKALVGAPDDDPEGRLLVQVAENIALSSPFLDMSLERAWNRYAPNPDDIIAALYRSPVFDGERRELIREGVAAYLEQDHVKAVHVLVPQIEHALRMLLTLIGVPVTRPPRVGTGMMYEKNLNEILREEEVRQALGESLWRYFLVFLADERGQNVRNWVCHGRLAPAQFGRQLSSRVMHVLLCLALCRSKVATEASSASKAT